MKLKESTENALVAAISAIIVFVVYVFGEYVGWWNDSGMTTTVNGEVQTITIQQFLDNSLPDLNKPKE